MKRSLAISALCALAVMACTGCDKSAAYRTVSQSSQVAVAPSASPPLQQVVPGTTKGGPAAHPASNGGSSVAPSPSPTASGYPQLPGYPQYSAGSTPAPATVSLASTCVVPGGRQTLSIVSNPNYVVGYDAQYSDSKDGRTYGGMDSNGRIDSTGHYASSWVVAPTAPLGQVVVWVAVGGSGESAFRQPVFQVKSSC